MEITEVRIKLMEEAGDRLQAFCSITFDDCFVIRDLKIIEGCARTLRGHAQPQTYLALSAMWLQESSPGPLLQSMRSETPPPIGRSRTTAAGPSSMPILPIPSTRPAAR